MACVPTVLMSSVCASPFCLATNSQATLPAAPGRFSAITCCPHSSVSFCASVRARMSEVPPGGKGMTMRTVRVGKACDQARPCRHRIARSATRTRDWIMVSFSIGRMVLKQRDYARRAPGTLGGVRVLDLSRLFAGNLLTQILGDFGAEVIKVEPPAGDTLRAWRTNGVSTHWKAYARNKKSLCLELRKQRARELLLDLVPGASLFIESFRPGTLEAMGLGPDVLMERNERLVVVRISGWGQDGPYRRRPGFGSLVEGMSGFAAINGFADREPVLPPMYLADAYAGLYGAIGTMVALREVEVNGGQGQVIDLPLLDPLFHVLGPQAANYRLTRQLKQRTGSRSSNSGPRNAYRTSDGRYVALSASTQKMAERALAAIGRPDLVRDPRYATNAARVKHAEELDAIIGAFVA